MGTLLDLVNNRIHILFWPFYHVQHRRSLGFVQEYWDHQETVKTSGFTFWITNNKCHSGPRYPVYAIRLRSSRQSVWYLRNVIILGGQNAWHRLQKVSTENLRGFRNRGNQIYVQYNSPVLLFFPISVPGWPSWVSSLGLYIRTDNKWTRDRILADWTDMNQISLPNLQLEHVPRALSVKGEIFASVENIGPAFPTPAQ